MGTTFVMNTVTHAVTEHTYAANSSAQVGAVTYVGSAGGLSFLDPAAQSTLRIESPIRLWGSAQYRRPRYAYIIAKNAGEVTFSIELANGTVFDYATIPTTKDVIRCDLGRGVKDNYLAFHLTNAGVSNFRLDRLEVKGKELKRKV